MKEFIGSRLDAGLLAQVEALAKKEERTRSDMLRLIIKRYFEHEVLLQKQKEGKSA